MNEMKDVVVIERCGCWKMWLWKDVVGIGNG